MEAVGYKVRRDRNAVRIRMQYIDSVTRLLEQKQPMSRKNLVHVRGPFVRQVVRQARDEQSRSQSVGSSRKRRRRRFGSVIRPAQGCRRNSVERGKGLRVKRWKRRRGPEAVGDIKRMYQQAKREIERASLARHPAYSRFRVCSVGWCCVQPGELMAGF